MISPLCGGGGGWQAGGWVEQEGEGSEGLHEHQRSPAHGEP